MVDLLLWLLFWNIHWLSNIIISSDRDWFLVPLLLLGPLLYFLNLVCVDPAVAAVGVDSVLLAFASHSFCLLVVLWHCANSSAYLVDTLSIILFPLKITLSFSKSSMTLFLLIKGVSIIISYLSKFPISLFSPSIFTSTSALYLIAEWLPIVPNWIL